MTSEKMKSFNYAIGMFGTSIPINMLKTYGAAYYVIQLGLTTAQWASILFIYTFIDAIDKVASRSLEGGGSGAEVSRQGVQRDLLPLVEGTTVSTKYGMVRTDHILFIASGAFHLSKPSDLIPELQGRLPIRVELSSLTVQDFEAILTQTDANLVRQYQALLATEGVTLAFTPEGISRLAEIACAVNESTENIGARRLSTVMERLLDEVSFEATRLEGQTVTVDAAYVDARLQALSRDEDLSRYIL